MRKKEEIPQFRTFRDVDVETNVKDKLDRQIRARNEQVIRKVSEKRLMYKSSYNEETKKIGLATGQEENE